MVLQTLGFVIQTHCGISHKIDLLLASFMKTSLAFTSVEIKTRKRIALLQDKPMINLRFIVSVALAFFLSYAALAQNNCSCEVYEALLKVSTSKADIYKSAIKDRSAICQAKAVELKGVMAIFESNNLDSAEYYLKKAERLYNKTDCGMGVLWNTYKQFFQVYWSRSDFPHAQAYGLKFIESAETAKNYYEQAIANTMIAIVFYRTQQFDKGIIFNDNAAALLDKIDNIKDKQNLLYLLSVRYMSHFLHTQSKSSLEKSLRYNLQHLALSKQLQDTAQFSRSYFNLSGTEDANKNWLKSIAYLDSGYIYMDKTDSIDLFDYHGNKAGYLLELKRYNEAAAYADSALQFALKIKNKHATSDIYRIMAQIAEGS